VASTTPDKGAVFYERDTPVVKPSTQNQAILEAIRTQAALATDGGPIRRFCQKLILHQFE
jgi:hypothetical protein